MVIDAKATEQQDPFHMGSQASVNSITALAVSARNLLLAHGFCYAFVVGFYGDFAHIVRFDRSSAVVSKQFKYRERPDILQRFFWRLVHPTIGSTIVGSDPDVRPLTNPDVLWIKEQLRKLRWDVPISDEELRKGRAVVVPESDAVDAKPRTLLLFDLLDVNVRLFSRATMVWLAIEDLRARPQEPSSHHPPCARLVVFKEAWRQITRRPETEFYQRLGSIPDDVRTGLPKMLFGADLGERDMKIRRAAGGKFSYEANTGHNSLMDPSPSSAIAATASDTSETCFPPDIGAPALTDPGLNSPRQLPADNDGCVPSPPYPLSAVFPCSPYQTHCWRLLFGDECSSRERSLVRCAVDTVGRPLKHFKTTRELVGAVRDAIEGHRQAWEVGVLHRDVSAGNVLISEQPADRLRGFLHDFDYSSMTKGVPPPLNESSSTEPLLRMGEACDEEDLKERTGTYYYMAQLLLRKKSIVHSVHHDLESFYWVLLWIVLRHTQHDLEVDPESPNPCTRVFRSGNNLEAADMKRAWLTETEVHFTVDGNKPLTDLMHQFRMLILEAIIMGPRAAPRRYLTHAAVLELFDTALARTDWPDPENDGPKPFAYAKPAPPRLNQPKRAAQPEDAEETEKRSGKRRKKEDGSPVDDDAFESTPVLRQSNRGSVRGSGARASGGSKRRGSKKQQS
ncbi:hypothetical protein BD309DRAFT_857048 [Dichomitus squalens]|nr:hypothetical protein BD309DRAFT_857048 [Dichomitus squalens]